MFSRWLGIDELDTQICPASVISSTNTFVKNSAFKTEFAIVYPWQSTTDYSWNEVFSGDIVNVFNSSFEGYKYLIYKRSTLAGLNIVFNFDSCIINGFTNLFTTAMVQGAQFSFSNSAIFLEEFTFKVVGGNNVFSFENNYWGNNYQPALLDNSGNNLSPSHWIILVSEGDEPVFKLTDGENVTEYLGSLPAKISYVADENGDVIPVML